MPVTFQGLHNPATNCCADGRGTPYTLSGTFNVPFVGGTPGFGYCEWWGYFDIGQHNWFNGSDGMNPEYCDIECCHDAVVVGVVFSNPNYVGQLPFIYAALSWTDWPIYWDMYLYHSGSPTTVISPGAGPDGVCGIPVPSIATEAHCTEQDSIALGYNYGGTATLEW